MTWAAGDSVALRDVRDSVVYFAWPVRVVEARPGQVVVAQRPGALGRVPTGYPADPPAVLAQFVSQRPVLVERAWESTITVSFVTEGATWVPRLFWDAETNHFIGYYVDFVRPVAFTDRTIDTLDLELDIVANPDGRWRYKDERSYARLRELGLVTDADHASVEAGKAHVTAAIEAGAFPFDGSWVKWRWPTGLAPASLDSGWPA